jgi:hypothetical protein
MARHKNAKGYCDERSIDVQELNICDYFHGKRKNSKARCRNCIHFHVLDLNAENETKSPNSVTKQDDV